MRVRRTLKLHPTDTVHYLVDSCFLVNKYLDVRHISDKGHLKRVESSQKWWQVIERQVASRKAKVFVPDIVVAETFKALSKKFYGAHWPYASSYTAARNRLRDDIHLPSKEARSPSRKVGFHDIQLNRDIIISVDRFFELAAKKYKSVSIVDIIVAATGKYLIDFYGFSKSDLTIVTTDADLYGLCRACGDLPPTFNPDLPSDASNKVFT